MTNKKINLRQCCSCKQKHDKFMLVKLVKQKSENVYNIDFNYNMDGRGIYICKNTKCILKTKKNKKINKIFCQKNIDLIEQNFILI